jgi:hypothetical protein
MSQLASWPYHFPASWPILCALNFACRLNIYLFNRDVFASILWLLQDGTYMASGYKEAAELMAGLKHCVALTDAGISAESGIATFRSKGGLWEKYDPMVYASIEAFREDPAKYWTIRGEFIRNTVLFGEQ